MLIILVPTPTTTHTHTHRLKSGTTEKQGMGHSDEVSQSYGYGSFKVKFTLLLSINNVVRVPTYNNYMCESAPDCTLERKYYLSVKFLYNPFTLGEHQHSMHHAPMTQLLWLEMTL